jgi:hypothetical protein
LYTEILDDPKYFRLSDNAKLGMVELMIVAKKVDMDGLLPSNDDVSFYTRRNNEWWQPVYVELVDIKFLDHNDNGFFIRKFSERQAAISDADRAKRSREKRNVPQYCHEPVTKRDGDTDGDTEEDIEEDIEEKQKKKSPASGNQYLPTGQYSEKVFRTITGMVTFPSRDSGQAINAIELLRDKYPDMERMIEYLTPFWNEWKTRPYSKTNLAWLIDWAVAGEIPDKRLKEEPMSRQQRTLKKLKDA